MCGRFALKTPAKKLAQVFQAEVLESVEINPHYNIAPTFSIPVVRYDKDKNKRVITRDYWGIVPSWAKNPTIAAYTSNARADTITEKASFKNAFKERRCLIPIDGFYEWDRSIKPSQPYYFTMKDDETFAVAGLWESWKVRWIEDERDATKSKAKKPVTFPITLGGRQYNQGDVLESCSIITTEANSLMAKVHDRMPVILSSKDHELWLDPKTDSKALLALLKLYPADEMQCL
jgi:putative SOS response-associated peptidase YedK